MLQRKLDFLTMAARTTIPYNICFTFIRQTKGIFDYANMVQVVLDLMVTYGWLQDDNTRYVKPFFGDVLFVEENPASYAPGVIIELLEEIS